MFFHHYTFIVSFLSVKKQQFDQIKFYDSMIQSHILATFNHLNPVLLTPWRQLVNPSEIDIH